MSKTPARDVQPEAAPADPFATAAGLVSDAWKKVVPRQSGTEARAPAGPFITLLLQFASQFLANCPGNPTGIQVKSTARSRRPGNVRLMRRGLSRVLQAGRRSESVDDAIETLHQAIEDATPVQIEAFMSMPVMEGDDA